METSASSLPSPELLRRLEALQRLLRSVSLPVAAHLRLETAGRTRDVLLDGSAAPAARPPIVQWESAPLAEVFYDTREGEEFELDLGERLLAGRVLERNLLGWEAGELVEVITERESCRRGPAGWSVHPRPRTLLPRPGDRHPRTVRLDAAQQAIVDLPARSSVLVLGEAGAGKTTVAVHRIRRLLEENRRWRAAVVVPTEPLRHRVESMLDRLGVDRVRVFDFDQWALQEARRAFPDLPTKDSRHAPAGVVRIKRDPALRVAMRRLLEGRRGKRQVRWEDLGELFGDRGLLEEMAAHADPLVPVTQIEEVLGHTREQFSVVEGEWLDNDGQAIAALDGESLDADTDAGRLDPEDAPVLFALDRMRAERGGPPAAAPQRFDLIFVDEAQELAPFELELLAQAHRGSLIVAGDAGQQVDPTACFRGWDATVADLGIAKAPRAELKIGYRCPPAIAAFANAIARGTAAPAAEEVRLLAHRHESHLVEWLIAELRALRQRDPAITVGVVVRDAARMSRLLERAIPVVGAEELRPGATHVVSVLAAKGLEFDTVVVADADAHSFPGDEASRRALYVAATRATHQLVLAWSGRASPLLPPLETDTTEEARRQVP